MHHKINWHEQWRIHGLNFKDGFVHVNLGDFGYAETKSAVKLEPGPGFGDLSHPTTNLVLKLLSQHVAGQTVLDIGCGSGILSISAVAMGANMAYGIDIDPEAILHARHNAKINRMTPKTLFCTAVQLAQYPIQGPMIVAMNMIRTEQQEAWKSVQALHSNIRSCLTSGILAQERDLYLEQCQRWGWLLQKEIQQGEWLGFHFIMK